MTEWQARIVPNWQGLTDALAIFRHVGNGFTEVYDGTTVQTVGEAIQVPPADLLQIPHGALAAIRDAIDEHLGVRYDEALVREVRDALDVERRRVDYALGMPAK